MVERKGIHSAAREPRYGTPDEENPEWTKEMFATARPLHEVLPKVAEEIRRTGRPRLERTKVQVSIRLDSNVLAGLRAYGSGWQTRVNEVLATALKRPPKASAKPAKRRSKPARTNAKSAKRPLAR